MIRKESIAEILNAGGTIKFPYKEKLGDWYGEVYITSFENYYSISPGVNVYDQDSAINYFLWKVLSEKNAAYIIDRLKLRGITTDLEDPDEDYIVEFGKEKKIVSDEFKKLGITKLKKGTSEEIEESLEKMVAKIEPNKFPVSLQNDLTDFLNLYALNSPYISISFCYSIDSQDTPFRNGINLGEFTPRRLEAAKNLELFKDPVEAKYLFTELTVSYYPKNGKDKIFKKYELKI
jgi:hypothetical protein